MLTHNNSINVSYNELKSCSSYLLFIPDLWPLPLNMTDILQLPWQHHSCRDIIPTPVTSAKPPWHHVYWFESWLMTAKVAHTVRCDSAAIKRALDPGFLSLAGRSLQQMLGPILSYNTKNEKISKNTNSTGLPLCFLISLKQFRLIWATFEILVSWSVNLSYGFKIVPRSSNSLASIWTGS